jgi:hypothetical protein
MWLLLLYNLEAIRTLTGFADSMGDWHSNFASHFTVSDYKKQQNEYRGTG